jgi:hypothetical protein
MKTPPTCAVQNERALQTTKRTTSLLRWIPRKRSVEARDVDAIRDGIGEMRRRDAAQPASHDN